MVDKISKKYGERGTFNVSYREIGTNLYAPDMALLADLRIGAKSLTLTLSTGTGSVPIPDTARLVGVKPVSSTAIRVGLEAPEADGTKTGAAAAGDLKKGCPVDAAVWTWFNVSTGASRTLYVKGGSSDVVEIVVM